MDGYIPLSASHFLSTRCPGWMLRLRLFPDRRPGSRRKRTDAKHTSDYTGAQLPASKAYQLSHALARDDALDLGGHLLDRFEHRGQMAMPVVGLRDRRLCVPEQALGGLEWHPA